MRETHVIIVTEIVTMTLTPEEVAEVHARLEENVRKFTPERLEEERKEREEGERRWREFQAWDAENNERRDFEDYERKHPYMVRDYIHALDKMHKALATLRASGAGENCSPRMRGQLKRWLKRMLVLLEANRAALESVK
jgi:hypothetical protein